MKQVVILECFIETMEKKIGDEWKHDVFISGYSSEHINFEIDGIEYVVNIGEVEKHFTKTLDNLKTNNPELLRGDTE